MVKTETHIDISDSGSAVGFYNAFISARWSRLLAALQAEAAVMQCHFERSDSQTNIASIPPLVAARLAFALAAAKARHLHPQWDALSLKDFEDGYPQALLQEVLTSLSAMGVALVVSPACRLWVETLYSIDEIASLVSQGWDRALQTRSSPTSEPDEFGQTDDLLKPSDI